jgi:hypothetical protein
LEVPRAVVDALVKGKMSAPAGDETQGFNVITIDKVSLTKQIVLTTTPGTAKIVGSC